MSKKQNRFKKCKPSPAKATLALKYIIDHFIKNKALDERLIAEILNPTNKPEDVADLVPAKNAAHQLACAEKTLANKRIRGDADLPHVKIGSRVYYKQADIAAFIKQNVRVNTSDKGGAK